MWGVRHAARGFSRGRQGPIRAAGPTPVTPRCDDLLVAYLSTNKSVHSAGCHIVWCPKYRRRVLVGELGTRLAEIIAEALRGAVSRSSR